MLGKLLAVLFAANVVIASVVVTSIGLAAQAQMKVAFLGDLGVDAVFPHKGHFFVPSDFGIIPNIAIGANRVGYKEALPRFSKVPEHGVATGHYHFGFSYKVGRGVRQDNSEAAKWYRTATVQGFGKAQILSNTDRLGEKGLTFYEEAAQWHRRAEEQGDAIAHFNLGILYYRGRGVSKSYTEAVSWFRKAAEQDDASAQTYLGLMYVLGWGVQQDNLLAHKWWSLAATKGNQQAQKNLDNIAKIMTLAQLTEAQKLARAWRAAFNKRMAK